MSDLLSAMFLAGLFAACAFIALVWMSDRQPAHEIEFPQFEDVDPFTVAVFAFERCPHCDTFIRADMIDAHKLDCEATGYSAFVEFVNSMDMEALFEE